MTFLGVIWGNLGGFRWVEAPLPLKIFDFVGFNGAISDFFGGGSGVVVSPKPAQDVS